LIAAGHGGIIAAGGVLKAANHRREVGAHLIRRRRTVDVISAAAANGRSDHT
jgi:hypothetical protein